VAPERLTSIDDFREAVTRCRHRFLWLASVAVPGFLISATLSVWPGWTAPGQSGSIAFLFAAALLHLAAVIFIDRKNRQETGMRCQHCGRPLLQAAGIVIATRRCAHCGRRHLSQLEDTEPASVA
jgi:phage FluMu protein Com